VIGDQGCLVAMDVLPVSIERVSKKVHAANLKNVRVVRGDAMNTELDAESMDAVLLFGVIPAPMLPLNRLLPEMHRVLKNGRDPGGVAANSWLVTQIDPSIRVIYVCLQTEGREQFSGDVNPESERSKRGRCF